MDALFISRRITFTHHVNSMFCALTVLVMLGSPAREAAAVPLTLQLVPVDSHITLNALFSGLPTQPQEGTAGTSDLVPGSPSNRTTFRGTITVAVDNVVAPTTIQILSSAADADLS